MLGRIGELHGAFPGFEPSKVDPDYVPRAGGISTCVIPVESALPGEPAFSKIKPAGPDAPASKDALFHNGHMPMANYARQVIHPIIQPDQQHGNKFGKRG